MLLLSQSLRDNRENKQPWIRCGSSAELRLGRLTYWLQVHAVRSICEEAAPSAALLLPSYTIVDMMSPCLLVHPQPSSPLWCHACRRGYWAIALCLVLALTGSLLYFYCITLPLRLSSSERHSCDKRQWLSWLLHLPQKPAAFLPRGARRVVVVSAASC